MKKFVYLSTLFILCPLFIPGCGPSESEIATITAAAWTPTPSRTHKPKPNPTPTQTPEEISQENNGNQFFEKIEFVEESDIPLQIGDEVYTIRSSVLHDMDEDGILDAIFTIATYPENIVHPVVILRGDGSAQNIAEQIFPDGVPSVAHANQIFFMDINNDSLEDLLISEAGNDHYPWYTEDAKIGIGLNRGGGIFEDVSAQVPEKAIGLRNYPLAAGDLFNDGIVRIVLPSQETQFTNGPRKTGLLYWNGTEFIFEQNWVDVYLWWWKEDLKSSSFMAVRDLDNDDWDDLYISGNWTTPNHRILYGNEAFPSAEFLYTLPDGPYGHTPWKTFEQSNVDIAIGADVNQVVFKDFDGDGDLDIVSVMEEVRNYKPRVFEDQSHSWYQNVFENGGAIYGNIWFHVLRNEGNRQFTDVIEQGIDLGYRYYIALLPLDFDLDGDIDLIGQYWSKTDSGECVARWESTIFINQGDMNFYRVEASDVFSKLSSYANERSWASDCATLGLGVFFPTKITHDGMTGLLVAPIEYDSENPRLRVIRFHATGKFSVPE